MRQTSNYVTISVSVSATVPQAVYRYYYQQQAVLSVTSIPVLPNGAKTNIIAATRMLSTTHKPTQKPCKLTHFTFLSVISYAHVNIEDKFRTLQYFEYDNTHYEESGVYYGFASSFLLGNFNTVITDCRILPSFVIYLTNHILWTFYSSLPVHKTAYFRGVAFLNLCMGIQQPFQLSIIIHSGNVTIPL